MSAAPLSALDQQWLARALTLAEEAAALASPNPTVGCVLVRDERSIGEGAHLYDRFDHAEIAALKMAAVRDESTRAATAYVTLEPCSQHGRTGPCADALIAAGVTRVVVATIDPNPAVRGEGLRKLRAAGIDVALEHPAAPLAARARKLNDAFAFWIQHRRPFVTLKAALSLDGKLAPPPSHRNTREPHWLTGAAARADVQSLRHTSDALLTGIGTILADDPTLTDRTGLPRRRPLLRCVLDTHLATPITAKLLAAVHSDVLIFCADSAPAAHRAALTSAGASVLPVPAHDGHLDLEAVMAALAARNITSLLCEAGSRLNGALLRHNLAHTLVFYFADIELGAQAVPFAHHFESPYTLQQRLQQTDRTAFPHGTAEDVRVSGYLQNPWSGVDATR